MIQFKQSPVVFDEDSHSYQLGEKRLLGITGLIHSVLGLGVYPDANEYVKDFIIPRAGSRGTAVHHAIQMYDELGIKQTTQIVTTRYGCDERDNIYKEEEEWDVSDELEAYIRHKEAGGFKALANELTVSDNKKWASQIDNVWLYEKTEGIWLVDTKTNNIDLYPLCGYFNPAYFNSGEEALKEYLSWQLSIYAELFEAENPELKVEGLACNWLRKERAEFWIIERKPSELVWELLKTEYIIGDTGPAYFHPDLSLFGIERGKETSLVRAPERQLVPQEVVEQIYHIAREAQEAKKVLDEMKARLREAMAANNVKSWDSGMFRATIAEDSVRETFDTTRFKKEHPDLYKQYLKQTTRNGGFTIKLKDND